MAESRRSGASELSLDEEAQKKKDRMFLILVLIGAIAVVAGMVWLSGFLSGN